MIKLLIPIILLTISSTAGAVDFGDGTDGNCSFTGAIDTDVQAIYNCSSFATTGAVTVSGSNPLTIKVSGNVTIDHTINLDGGDGNAGAAAGHPIAGGTAGPGGYAGASCPLTCSNEDGLDGGNNSGGLGGSEGTTGGFGEGSGGGGSGGLHRTSGGAAGGDGESNFGVAGVGGAIPSSGHGDELNFENVFIGGAGGGAGGSGANAASGSGNKASGGTGGGGGGAIKIWADGDISINNGGISANGGTGGDGLYNGNEGPSGGGGGGAGGAIWLYSTGEITLSGGTSISATGGLGGATSTNGSITSGAGGKGGDGRLRFDDLDGTVSGTGTVTPAATTVSLSTSGNSPIEVYESDIAFGCGSMSFPSDNNKNGPLNFLMGFILVYLFLVISKGVKRN